MLHFSAFFTVYFLTLAALLGLVFGSFCNAWAWRITHGESIARGRSHCAVCGHALAPRDLVPLLSYLLLHGRCRYCGAAVSPRYPAMEALSMLYFVSAVLRWDLSVTALRFLILGALLLVLALVDYESRILPDGLLLGAAFTALLRYFDQGAAGLKSGMIGFFAVGVPLLLVVLLFDRLMGRETMGGGDIKLLAVLALHFGAGQMVFLIITACALGLAVALPTRKRNPNGIPFGPSIALAAWITMLVGQNVLSWYLHSFF